MLIFFGNLVLVSWSIRKNEVVVIKNNVDLLIHNLPKNSVQWPFTSDLKLSQIWQRGDHWTSGSVQLIAPMAIHSSTALYHCILLLWCSSALNYIHLHIHLYHSPLPALKSINLEIWIKIVVLISGWKSVVIRVSKTHGHTKACPHKIFYNLHKTLTLEHKTGNFSYFWYNLTKFGWIFYVF